MKYHRLWILCAICIIVEEQYRVLSLSTKTLSSLSIKKEDIRRYPVHSSLLLKELELLFVRTFLGVMFDVLGFIGVDAMFGPTFDKEFILTEEFKTKNILYKVTAYLLRFSFTTLHFR